MELTEEQKEIDAVCEKHEMPKPSFYQSYSLKNKHHSFQEYLNFANEKIKIHKKYGNHKAVKDCLDAVEKIREIEEAHEKHMSELIVLKHLTEQEKLDGKKNIIVVWCKIDGKAQYFFVETLDVSKNGIIDIAEKVLIKLRLLNNESFDDFKQKVFDLPIPEYKKCMVPYLCEKKENMCAFYFARHPNDVYEELLLDD